MRVGFWLYRQSSIYFKKTWLKVCCGAILSGPRPRFDKIHDQYTLLIPPRAFKELKEAINLLKGIFDAKNKELGGPDGNNVVSPFVSGKHRMTDEQVSTSLVNRCPEIDNELDCQLHRHHIKKIQIIRTMIANVAWRRENVTSN